MTGADIVSGRLLRWLIALMGLWVGAGVITYGQEAEGERKAQLTIEKLKSEVEALLKQRQGGDKSFSAAGTERQRLQQELKELLQRIESRPLPSYRGQKIEPPAKKFEIGIGDKPLDLLRSATNLFQDGDVDAALRTFRMIDTSALGREDRAYVKYMIATCLRRTGRLSEAASLYREVAEGREDDFLMECAIWQLSLIRSTQELQSQLERLRGKIK
ncbi:MAG: hypothetical protein RMJ88_03345 [Thermogemmata sp.]|nr:hypothetical protein [Thermogemmata sp.]